MLAPGLPHGAARCTLSAVARTTADRTLVATRGPAPRHTLLNGVRRDGCRCHSISSSCRRAVPVNVIAKSSSLATLTLPFRRYPGLPSSPSLLTNSATSHARHLYHDRLRSFYTSSSQRAESGRATTRTVDYLLADVGEGITECEIVKWFVEPGSHVEEFDVLVEVQSDKASVEITSRYTGTVVEHCYNVGQVARVGSPLCRINVQGKGGEEDQAANQNEVQGTSSAHSQTGTEEQQQQLNDTSAGEPVQSQETTYDPAREAKHERHRTLATPAVRRLTRENAVDITDVHGTGRDGRVTKEDVQSYLDRGKSSSEASSGDDKSAPTVTPPSMTTVPLSGVRKAMFKAMSATWSAPHFGYSEEIDVTQLELIRRQWNQSSAASVPTSLLVATGAKEEDVSTSREKLTLLPFLLKALSLALVAHPIFRSTLQAGAMELRQTEEHRLSVAFASSKGLVTPTLRGDVRQLSVLDIARQVQTLQRQGATRGLSKDELGAGATLTLSNIGSVGGTHTFPLIPPTGQLIIGAVGRARDLPRFDAHDNVVKARILPVSFSADHRVVEGVELARFVDDWKRLLENPTSWLLALR